ncbi:MAG: hypothetical protein GY859_37120, partial [Desulfobacterales bacterium]|nr:hypothetical protein [Desulfobacterales bacterium]
MFKSGSKSKSMMNRRMRVVGLMFAVAAALIMAAGPSHAAGKMGGVFKMAIPTDMTQVDLHQTSAEIDNGVLSMTVYET